MNSTEMLDQLQEAVIKDGKKKKNDEPKYKFDKLKMYFGEDIIYKGIQISIPTIGDILNIGEREFYAAINPFLYNSTSIRLMLWDIGIDWNKFSDIQVFDFLSKIIIDKSPQNLIFQKTDFSKFELITFDDNVQFLYNSQDDIALSEDDYMYIAEYLRTLFNFHPKIEKAKGKSTKAWIIQEERMKEQKNDQKKYDSQLLPLVSSCINHPGFKYKLEDLKQVNIYQFMDSVQRIQKYEQGIAALRGIYGGMVSAKDIPDNLINFMGDL